LIKYLIIISLTLISLSCTNEVDIIFPEFSDGSILEGTTPIPDFSKSRMEGVYQITEGNDFFKDRAVIKWNDPDLLSIFCEKDGAYMVLKSGVSGSSLLFEGTWRYSYGTETGLVRLTISPENGGSELLGDSTANFTVKFEGSFGKGNDQPGKSLVINFTRKFSSTVINRDFKIVAHRGGGRNSDYLGVSENTNDMIALSEQRGSNGIEIDVKLSEDGVPFIYHDSDINLRLVEKSVIWGKIEDFTFPQLKTLITLKHGEVIESLDEMLEYVLNNTNLKFVWLDMKSDKDDMSKVIPIQQEFLDRAAAMGRDLRILIGLPTQDKVDQFLAVPNFQDLNNLCELSTDIVRQTDAEVWGPRWTLGLQSAEVDAMQSEGREIITWTLDDPHWIKSFVQDGDFDGILTNYPTAVAYTYYVQ
jgi:glycerophosphoryl diester phosphodiesterase